MDIGSVLDVNSSDTLLSILPIHHVFECTVGFLFSLYKGARTVFCDGLRHVVDNLKEYQVTVMACVPGIYERIFGMIRKGLEKQGKLEDILAKEEKYRNCSMEERKQAFPEIHEMLGGKIKLFISGAASLDRNIEEKYRLLGLNLVQGYGLTETSPVVSCESDTKKKPGSIGFPLSNLELKIVDPDSDGVGEITVKGPSVMLGYYKNEEATKKAMQDGWFSTGDFGYLDKKGYLYISGRKSDIIVLEKRKKYLPTRIRIFNQ